MALERGRLRIAVDVSQSSPFTDKLTGVTPDFWRGEDIQLELAFYYGDALADVSEINEITLLIKDESRDGDPLVSITIGSADINEGLTLGNWTSGSGEHCTIKVPKESTNFDLGGADSKPYWLVLVATTTVNPTTLFVLGGTKINILESGYTNAVASTPASAPTLANGMVLLDQNLSTFLVTIYTDGGISTLNIAPTNGGENAPIMTQGVILHDQNGSAYKLTLWTEGGVTTANLIPES